MTDTLDKIKEIVIDKLGVDEAKVTPEAKFIDELGADSLDTVELIMQFEDDLTSKYLMKMLRKFYPLVKLKNI